MRRQQTEAVEFCPEYGRGLLTVQLVQLGRADLWLRSVVPNHLHMCVCVRVCVCVWVGGWVGVGVGVGVGVCGWVGVCVLCVGVDVVE